LKPSVREIVADTGPLIALSRIGKLWILPRLFAGTLVTETVLAECLARPDRPEGAAITAALDAGQLILEADVANDQDWSLDAGEATVITAALARNAGILMDDRAGRRVAGILGIPLIGVLGVLVLAKRKEMLPSIRPTVEQLVGSGYYLTDHAIDEALRLAGE